MAVTEREQRIAQTIALPEPRREFARSLEQEYREDLATKYLAPVQIYDLQYKVEVLHALLESGTVDIPLLSQKLREKKPGNYHWSVFSNAVKVVNDLIQTGGANLEIRGLLYHVRES